MPESVSAAEVEKKEESQEHKEESEVDVYFEPIVNLPLIDVSNNEENEVEMLKLRAKLYRYDSSCDPPEWKERGTGEVKLLKHQTKHSVRVVMRRDKTLKICANHFITPWMQLKPNCGSDRAWVWSVLADFADEQLKPELLAIRFANAQNASLFKDTFDKARKIVATECEIYAGKSNPDNESYSETESESEDESDYEDAPGKNDKETTEKHSKDDTGTEEVTQVLEKLEVKEDKDKEKTDDK